MVSEKRISSNIALKSVHYFSGYFCVKTFFIVIFFNCYTIIKSKSLKIKIAWIAQKLIKNRITIKADDWKPNVNDDDGDDDDELISAQLTNP